MIIEIPGCDFRISGEKCDWQIQYEHERKNGPNTWEGKYFFPSLEFAIGKAYELALRGSAAKVDISRAYKECERVKDELIAAVRKVVDECSNR